MPVVTEQLSNAINEFLQHEHIVGLALQQGAIQINNRLPLSDSRSEQLTDAVHQLCNGFDSVGRHSKHYVYGYNSGTLVIVCLGEIRLILLLQKPAEIDSLAEQGRHFLEKHTRDFLQPHEEPVMANRLTAPAKNNLQSPDTSRISLDLTRPIQVATTRPNGQHPASTEETPEPVEEANNLEEWVKFRDSLCSIFSKVHGAAQVVRLIEREVKALGGTAQTGIPTSQFRALGDTLIAKVANKSKKRTLIFDLNEIYAEMGILTK